MQRLVGGDAASAAALGGALGPALTPSAPEALYDKLRPGPGKRTSEVAAHQSARIHRALVEVVADQGYDVAKVRDVVHLAGVSTRAFYELFDGKEDCFLRTHEMLMRRVARGIIVSQAGEHHGWRDRLGMVFEVLAKVLMQEPEAVRLVTVDAYTASPTVLGQARRAQATFEALIREALARAPDGIDVPPLVVEGMVSGVTQLIRSRSIAGREQELPQLMDDLEGWVLYYPDENSVCLAELDSRSVSMRPVPNAPESTSGTASEDRAMILAAAAKLVAVDGYGGLTVPRIRAGAGISRRKFNTHFDGVEDCYLAIIEQRAEELLKEVGRAQIRARTWAGGIYWAIATLSNRVASDPILTSICLKDDFVPGSSGSRCRKRLMAAVVDQLIDSVPSNRRPNQHWIEASVGAVWELFHKHVVRTPTQQRLPVAATLSYLALAPVTGPSIAIAAIRKEQLA